MYLEIFLSANEPVLQDHLGFLQVNTSRVLFRSAIAVFLQKVYVALDEPDGVAGVVAVRNSEPSIQEEMVEFESTGNGLYIYDSGTIPHAASEHIHSPLWKIESVNPRSLSPYSSRRVVFNQPNVRFSLMYSCV